MSILIHLKCWVSKKITQPEQTENMKAVCQLGQQMIKVGSLASKQVFDLLLDCIASQDTTNRHDILTLGWMGGVGCSALLHSVSF